MTGLNSNILLAILAVIIILALIYYLSRNNDQPIHNHGTIGPMGSLESLSMGSIGTVQPASKVRNAVVTAADMAHGAKMATVPQPNYRAANPPILDNRRADEISGSIVDDLVASYSVEDRPYGDEGGIGSFGGCDPMADFHGAFDNYGRKRQLNMRRMEEPYYEDDYDPRDFSYKKKMFTKRTPDDVKQLFDVQQMLPHEIEEDWFDVEPLLTTKKIKGTHLIHPKVHMGVNTVGSSLRNATHDIRGDIPNPKINVSPWMQSTIEPDTNIKGICNAI